MDSLDYTHCCCLLYLCSVFLHLCRIFHTIPSFAFFNVSLLFLFQYRYHISGPLCFQPLHHPCSDAACVRLSSMLPRHPRYLYHCLFIWCVFFSRVSHEIMRNYLFFFYPHIFIVLHSTCQTVDVQVHIWWMHT